MDLSKDYDSFEALSEAVKSLDNLQQLASARRIAGYQRHEHLNNWIILGRFMLDSCGNFMKIMGGEHHGIIPAERYPDFPRVLSQEALWEYIKDHEESSENISIGSSPSWLPEATQICPVCNKGWTVDNCHDFIDSHKSKLVNLDPYINHCIAYFKDHWNRSPKVIWSVQSETPLKNKRYIDRSIVDSELGQKYKWKVNERGFVEATNDHVIERGDSIIVNIWTFRHEKCYRTRQAKLERAYFKRAFRSAGYQDIQMTQTPNQYHGGDCTVCAPWYEVIADGISFTIGWRKRVISIHVKDPQLNLLQIFPNEDVTKEKDYIHAWGRKKCVEYLSTIKNKLLVK